MNSSAEDIRHALETMSNEEKCKVLPRFFKTGKGEYGEGDRFLGVVVPNVRKVAREYIGEPFDVVAELLKSPWHECRLCALLMLVERFKKSDEAERGQIFDFYLSHTDGINNWDLVDLSAPYIVGAYLLDKPRCTLYELAASDVLWTRRIAVVATLMLIRSGQFDDTLRLAEMQLARPERMHDLMQKAVGWMLREVGKRDKLVLTKFLDSHAPTMPRTMLRYAIEKLTEEERRHYMSARVSELSVAVRGRAADKLM